MVASLFLFYLFICLMIGRSISKILRLKQSLVHYMPWWQLRKKWEKALLVFFCPKFTLHQEVLKISYYPFFF